MKHLSFVVIDVETNGLSPDENEIIDIGIIRIKNAEISVEYNSLVKPINPIPPIITSLTGISNKDVKNAPVFNEIASIVVEFIGNAIIIGHNVNFDLSMVNKALARCNLPRLQNETIDTINLYSLIEPCGKSYKLESIADTFLGKTDNFHRAITDARITGEVFLKVIDTIKKYPLNLLYHITRLFHYAKNPTADVINRCYEYRIKKIGKDDSFTLDWKSLIKTDNDLKNKAFPETAADYKNDMKPQMIIEKFRKHIDIDNEEMIIQICRSFNEKAFLYLETLQSEKNLIQALIPAALWSTTQASPVAIAVASTTQQKLVSEVMSKIKQNFNDLIVSELQYPGNYICLSKFDVLLHAITETAGPAEVLDFAPILTWLNLTKTGNLEELHKKIYYRFQKHLFCEPSLCLNYRCEHNTKCFVKVAKTNASKANIIIINLQSLLYDDQSARMYLPEYKHLIILNAHTIINMTEIFAKNTLSLKQITKLSAILVDNSQGIIQSAADRFETTNVNNLLQDQIITNSELLINEIGSFNDQINRLFDALLNLRYAYKKKANQKTIHIPINNKFLTTAEWKKIDVILTICREKINDIIVIAEKLQNILESENLPFFKNLLFCIIEFIYLFNKLAENLQRISNNSPLYFMWIEILNKKNSLYALIQACRNNYINDFKNILHLNDNVIFISPNLSINNQFDYFTSHIESSCKTKKYLSHSDDNKQPNLLYAKFSFDLHGNYKNFKIRQHQRVLLLLSNIKGRTIIITNKSHRIGDIYSAIQKDLQGTKRIILKQELYKSNNTNMNIFYNTATAILIASYDFVENMELAGKKISAVLTLDLPVADVTEPTVKHTIDEYKKLEINWLHKHLLPLASIKFRSTINKINEGTNKLVVINLSLKAGSPHLVPYFKLQNCTSTETDDNDYLLKVIKLWLN